MPALVGKETTELGLGLGKSLPSCWHTRDQSPPAGTLATAKTLTGNVLVVDLVRGYVSRPGRFGASLHPSCVNVLTALPVHIMYVLGS